MAVALESPPRSGRQLEAKFHRLRDRWRAETIHVSSTARQVMHPAYQSIIGMGPEVVPILLREVEQGVGWWFWALAAITEEDPAPPDARGDKSTISEAWLEWGRRNGLLD